MYVANIGGVNSDLNNTFYLSPDASQVLICGSYSSPLFQTDPSERLYTLSSSETTYKAL
jgi:hypothetical protein